MTHHDQGCFSKGPVGPAALAAFGALGEPELQLLDHLLSTAATDRSPKTLGQETGLKPEAVTKALHTLAAAGYVTVEGELTPWAAGFASPPRG
ncbi:hypothetical protein [Streptomyces sp. NPDC056883]|uniref:hypothetical protein n=1 Tax=Streptomyces sp. NPDC056883 TaxID=3345959 RepID=UPI0036A920AC